MSKFSKDVLQAPRGTHDVMGTDMKAITFLTHTGREVCTNFTYEQIDGPILEHLELFKNENGNFPGEMMKVSHGAEQEAGHDMCLRPEFTKTIARIVASRAATLPHPCRFFQIGPFFRAERPQAGRLRQFYQLNVDSFFNKFPEAEVELINMMFALIQRSGITISQVRLHIGYPQIVSNLLVQAGVPNNPSVINSFLTIIDRRRLAPERELIDGLGNLCAVHSLPSDRIVGFVLACVAMRSSIDKLEAESFIKGILEALPNSKSEDREIKMLVYQLVAQLWELFMYIRNTDMAPSIIFDLTIVRGLDYYTGVCFEMFPAPGVIQNNRALIGGGRYDNLISRFEGPPVRACGFAIGFTMWTEMLKNLSIPFDKMVPSRVPVACFCVDTQHALNPQHLQSLTRLAFDLCRIGTSVIVSPKAHKPIDKQIKDARDRGILFAIIVDDRVFQSGEVEVRSLFKDKTQQVPFANLGSVLTSLSMVTRETLQNDLKDVVSKVLASLHGSGKRVSELIPTIFPAKPTSPEEERLSRAIDVGEPVGMQFDDPVAKSPSPEKLRAAMAKNTV